jgi:hypothetical protein
MKILSHRGYWKIESEKNTLIAFERSFRLGFGTETDFRDFNGRIVISHDVPTTGGNWIYAEDFFECYKSFDLSLPLALNIKSDGIQELLGEILRKYKIENYFVFDMSIPDTIGYLKSGFNVFTRQSEFEPNPAFLDEVKGIWLDEFVQHWISKDLILNYLNQGKILCLVSPDLHKRNYYTEWETYKNIEIKTNDQFGNLWLCTDYPETAKSYFYED